MCLSFYFWCCLHHFYDFNQFVLSQDLPLQLFRCTRDDLVLFSRLLSVSDEAKHLIIGRTFCDNLLKFFIVWFCAKSISRSSVKWHGRWHEKYTSKRFIVKKIYRRFVWVFEVIFNGNTKENIFKLQTSQMQGFTLCRLFFQASRIFPMLFVFDTF